MDSISTNNEASGFWRDVHKVRSADTVAKVLRTKLEAKFVGGKALNGTEERMELTAAQILAELQAAKIIRAYKQPTVEPGPATGAIVTSANSTILSAPVMLVDTTKFIFIQVALQSPTSIPV